MNRLSVTGKSIYKHRKETIERSFACAKQLHHHRYARFRGLAKVKAQALQVAACQNMKKMANLLEKSFAPLFTAFFVLKTAYWSS